MSNMHLKFKRRQFDMCFAFSVTINKSQGQTFDKIYSYLLKPEVTGIALSWVQSLGSLSAVFEMNGIVNGVYNEVYE
jgi:hypothetical protein